MRILRTQYSAGYGIEQAGLKKTGHFFIFLLCQPRTKLYEVFDSRAYSSHLSFRRHPIEDLIIEPLLNDASESEVVLAATSRTCLVSPIAWIPICFSLLPGQTNNSDYPLNALEMMRFLISPLITLLNSKNH